jgi:hypothetical protein
VCLRVCVDAVKNYNSSSKAKTWPVNMYRSPITLGSRLSDLESRYLNCFMQLKSQNLIILSLLSPNLDEPLPAKVMS